MSLAGGHFVASQGVDHAPDETQKSLAASITELQKFEAGEIEYEDDKIAPTQVRNGLGHRIAKVRCAVCPCSTEIHQAQRQDGEWPDALASLSVFGWQTNGKQWFCGKTCGERYALKVRDHGNEPLPAIVKRVNAPGYIKALYGQTAKPAPTVDPAPEAESPVVADETTPAIPPGTSRRATTARKA